MMENEIKNSEAQQAIVKTKVKKGSKSAKDGSKKAVEKVGDILNDEPLTLQQKELIRANFIRLRPLHQKCNYCSREVKNDHLKRLASHFLRCFDVPDVVFFLIIILICVVILIKRYIHVFENQQKREQFLILGNGDMFSILTAVSKFRFDRLNSSTK
jgi:hypothetical protein